MSYLPKIVTCLRQGYTGKLFRGDLIAGISLGIIALPLSLAFAIGSGVSPERGLYTAIVAGFLISLLGGSRVQIGGPTGAFVIIVYSVVRQFGYEGLALATLMAGVMILLMGIARFGAFLKFIPYPVTTGFTTGIALVIFSAQVGSFFGLSIATLPVEFVFQWEALVKAAPTINPWTTAISLSVLLFLFESRRRFPRLPGALIAIVLSTLVVAIWDLPVETIQSKFGAIPRGLPAPALPSFSLERIRELFPSAIAIALLGAIESLLSAVVADGLTGHRHRSNCELVAQAIANLGSVAFGGIPATGAIARTSANIKLGGKTPVAGMIHAVTVLLLMFCFAPYAALIPIASLAAILVYVAWGMSELESFSAIVKSRSSDTILLLVTFGLTVFVDLVAAVLVGVVLAALIFLKKMAQGGGLTPCRILLEEERSADLDQPDSELLFRKDIPSDVMVFEISGPFFYGNANLLRESLIQLKESPRVYILRMDKVTMVDATGVKAIKEFNERCKKRGILFLLSELPEEMEKKLARLEVARFATFDGALKILSIDDPR